MRSVDMQPDLLDEWRAKGPHRCWLCGDTRTNPHHCHAAADIYWQHAGLSPHWPWNIRPLCLDCHQRVKSVLGEFHYSNAPAKRESRKKRVRAFLREFRQERARELIPKWVLEEVMFNETPSEPYRQEIEQIKASGRDC